MSNPKPVCKFESPYDKRLSPNTVALRLPVEIDEFVRSLPNKTEWLRMAIAAQYERDMAAINDTDSDTLSST